MVRRISLRQLLSKVTSHLVAWGNPWGSWSTYCPWTECVVSYLPKPKCTSQVQIDSNWSRFILESWSPYSYLSDRIFHFPLGRLLWFCLKTVRFLHVYCTIQSGISCDFVKNMHCWLWRQLGGFGGPCLAIYKLPIWQWPEPSSNRWQRSFHHAPLE